MKKKTLLACFLAVIMGVNILLPPPPVPSPDPSGTVQPFNNLWDGDKD